VLGIALRTVALNQSSRLSNDTAIASNTASKVRASWTAWELGVARAAVSSKKRKSRCLGLPASIQSPSNNTKRHKHDGMKRPLVRLEEDVCIVQGDFLLGK
jgi:hypothetical protein